MKYEFHEVKTIIHLHIESSNCVGLIGKSSFHSTVKKNKGNASRTGVAYIIECGQIIISSNDNVQHVEKIQLWILPQKSANELEAEVRQMEFLDPFPMGKIKLYKTTK
jgi:hypothetical protein